MSDRQTTIPGLPAYLQGYLNKAGSSEVDAALQLALERTIRTFGAIDEEGSLHRYAPGKWSIREMLQHITDSERIFAYRALRFARNDVTNLPSFDENAYATASKADHRSLRSILDEHLTVREASRSLFAGLDGEMLDGSGIAGGNRVGVRALGLIIAGHAEHHCDILEQRYR
ncbi:MAG TPA: DinB family protein [Flavobacteriales bacterium]|nr:DinB family protein [Flavobacteriales bacterium]HNU56628.1 DinB family protein [Flavobacteriales bacterium]